MNAEPSRQTRFQRRAREQGLCITCAEPAKLRRDGKPGIYCAHHVAMNARRNKTGPQRVARYLAKLKQQRAVRRRWLGGKHRCSVCGGLGHNKRTCIQDLEGREPGK